MRSQEDYRMARRVRMIRNRKGTGLQEDQMTEITADWLQGETAFTAVPPTGRKGDAGAFVMLPAHR